jgi:hypothetical protein
MTKIALFAFNGEPMCFIHVLLNALDMSERGYEVKIVIESSATKLVPELAEGDNPVHRLYEKAKGLDLIDGVCKACSNKMGIPEARNRRVRSQHWTFVLKVETQETEGLNI